LKSVPAPDAQELGTKAMVWFSCSKLVRVPPEFS